MTDEQTSAMRLIRRKKKKNIIHEIYLYDHTLVKRFVKTAPFAGCAQALAGGAHCPPAAFRDCRCLRPMDSSVKRMNGATEIVYAREYLDGSQVTAFGTGGHGCHGKNDGPGSFTRGDYPGSFGLKIFIRTPDGKILFIDFGRSIILNPKNPSDHRLYGKGTGAYPASCVRGQ